MKKKFLKLKFITIIIILDFVAKRIDEENKKEHGSRLNLSNYGSKWQSNSAHRNLSISVYLGRGALGWLLSKGKSKGNRSQMGVDLMA